MLHPPQIPTVDALSSSGSTLMASNLVMPGSRHTTAPSSPHMKISSSSLPNIAPTVSTASCQETSAYQVLAFGFPGAPEIPVSKQNLGFHDQRMSLAWVQDNIAAFGGDPKKVTVAGSSAGALSVDSLLTSYTSDPPFCGAILESGQISVLSRGKGEGNADSWNTLADALNCSNFSATGGALNCVRKAPATRIKDIIEKQSLLFNAFTDNITLIANPGQKRLQHQTPNVPMLVGSNAQEGNLFVYGEANLTAFLATYFPVQSQDALYSLQQAMTEAYPVGQSTQFQDEFQQMGQIEGDLIFHCVSSCLTHPLFTVTNCFLNSIGCCGIGSTEHGRRLSYVAILLECQFPEYAAYRWCRSISRLGNGAGIRDLSENWQYPTANSAKSLDPARLGGFCQRSAVRGRDASTCSEILTRSACSDS